MNKYIVSIICVKLLLKHSVIFVLVSYTNTLSKHTKQAQIKINPNSSQQQFKRVRRILTAQRISPFCCQAALSVSIGPGWIQSVTQFSDWNAGLVVLPKSNRQRAHPHALTMKLVRVLILNKQFYFVVIIQYCLNSCKLITFHGFQLM